MFKIRARARKVVGQGTAPRAAAEKIVRWVHEEVAKERAFDGDALEVLRKTFDERLQGLSGRVRPNGSSVINRLPFRHTDPPTLQRLAA